LSALVANHHPQRRSFIPEPLQSSARFGYERFPNAAAPRVWINVQRKERTADGQIHVSGWPSGGESARHSVQACDDGVRLLRIVETELIAVHTILGSQGVQVRVGQDTAVGLLPGADMDGGNLVTIGRGGGADSQHAFKVPRTA
jgi:hypothetical protein